MTPLGLREICRLYADHNRTRHDMRTATMPEKNPDLWTIILFHLAAISGAMGGCAAGAAIGLKRREIMFGQIIAYGFIGFVCGGASYAFGHWFGHPGDVKSIMGWAVAVGVGVPLILACHNFGARYAFRVFGVEVEFTMRKPGEDRRRIGRTDDERKD